jgi:hypothetical protein
MVQVQVLGAETMVVEEMVQLIQQLDTTPEAEEGVLQDIQAKVVMVLLQVITMVQVAMLQKAPVEAAVEVVVEMEADQVEVAEV